MRRVRPGVVAAFAAVLPLIAMTSACSRDGERRVVAPELPSDSPQVTGARWVWEPGALAGAVQAAGKSPLVQRALAEAPIGRLRPRYDLAIRAVGDGVDGRTVGLTLLPFAVDGDPTHAAFVSIAQGFGREAAEFAEMIIGRDPGPNETGFHQIVWGDRIAWVRSGDAYFPDPAGGLRSPLRRAWTKLFDCLVERMPAGCAAGAGIATGVLPGEPHAAAIGCGIGAAGGAVSCVADFLRDK